MHTGSPCEQAALDCFDLVFFQELDEGRDLKFRVVEGVDGDTLRYQLGLKGAGDGDHGLSWVWIGEEQERSRICERTHAV